MRITVDRSVPTLELPSVDAATTTVVRQEVAEKAYAGIDLAKIIFVTAVTLDEAKGHPSLAPNLGEQRDRLVASGHILLGAHAIAALMKMYRETFIHYCDMGANDKSVVFAGTEFKVRGTKGTDGWATLNLFHGIEPALHGGYEQAHFLTMENDLSFVFAVYRP
jgi:uncharacterized protein (DUF2237 family)